MAAGSVDICTSLSSLLILVGSGLRYDYDLWILFPSNLSCGLGFETSGYLVSMGSCASANEQSETYQVNQDTVVILLCEFTESLGLLARSYRYVTGHVTWFLWSDEPPERLEIVTMVDYTKPFTRVIIFSAGDEGKIYFHDFYKPKNSIIVLLKPIEPISAWDQERHVNLEGNILRVTAVMSEDYAFDTKITLDADNNPKMEASFAIHLLWALQEKLGFVIRLRLASGWGYFNEHTQDWQGMIADLVHNDADLAISSTSMLPFRREAVDFNIATTSLHLSGFFKKAGKAVDNAALIEPFRSTFWYALIFGILIVIIALSSFKIIIFWLVCPTTTIVEFIPGSGVVEYDDKQSRVWCTLDCALWTISALCLKSFYYVPKYDSYRIVVGIWLLTSVILYAAYSGTLISFLSVEVESLKSLENLVAASYDFAITTYPIPRKIMKQSPDPVIRDIYHRSKPDVEFDGLWAAKKSILEGYFTFFTDDISAYYVLTTDFTSEEACQVRDLKVPYARQEQSTMIPKLSPLKRPIDQNILWLREIGLIPRWSKLYVPKRLDCVSLHFVDGVQLRSLTVAYSVLFVGFLMSLAILTLENCTRMMKYRRRRTAIAPIVHKVLPILQKMPVVQAWVDADAAKVAHSTASSKRWKFFMNTKNFTRKVRAVSWRKTKAFFSSASFDETDDFLGYPTTIVIESKQRNVNVMPVAVIPSTGRCLRLHK